MTAAWGSGACHPSFSQALRVINKENKSMRLLRLVLLSSLLVGCRVANTADSSDDTNKWQGTWKLVSCTYDGQPQMADMLWIVDGDHYDIRLHQVTHGELYPLNLDTRLQPLDG